MKQFLAILMIFAMGSSLRAEDRDHPLDITVTAVSVLKGNLRYKPEVSVLFGIDVNGDMRTVKMDANGLISVNTEVSKVAWPTTVEQSTFTQTTATAISWNVTTVAGTSGPCIVCLGSASGTGAAFLWAKTSSITVPAVFDGITNAGGYDIAVDGGAQCIAAGIGDHLHTIGKATGDVEITRTTDLVTGQ